MKSDIIATAKITAIIAVCTAVFIAGCAAIGMWMPFLLISLFLVAFIYGNVREERLERERKQAKKAAKRAKKQAKLARA